MESFSGYLLSDALRIMQGKYNLIIKIIKIKGINKKFNDLKIPYIIQNYMDDSHITLYVTYY